MYECVRPEIAIPVHGERRHLLEHARFSKTVGAGTSMPGRNGEMVRIAPNGPTVVDIVPTGRLYEDGGQIVSSTDDGMRLRRKMAYAGHVGVSVVVNTSGKIVSGPEPRIAGFPEGGDGEVMDDLLDAVVDAAERAFNELPSKSRKDEDAIEEKLRGRVKRVVRDRTGKRAIVEIHAHIVKKAA
jgi:ribonuclease J